MRQGSCVVLQLWCEHVCMCAYQLDLGRRVGVELIDANDRLDPKLGLGGMGHKSKGARVLETKQSWQEGRRVHHVCVPHS